MVMWTSGSWCQKLRKYKKERNLKWRKSICYIYFFFFLSVVWEVIAWFDFHEGSTCTPLTGCSGCKSSTWKPAPCTVMSHSRRLHRGVMGSGRCSRRVGLVSVYGMVWVGSARWLASEVGAIVVIWARSSNFCLSLAGGSGKRKKGKAGRRNS